jgi:outer membrane protein insertion porin family
MKLNDSASNEVKAFVSSGGQTTDASEVDDLDARSESFNEFGFTTFWTHDSRDSAIFPNEGWYARLEAEVAVPGSDLTYYKLSYKHRHFFPVARHLTFSTEANVGFGDGYSDTGILPIFENYFVGGPGTVRGFKAYSLGPRDSNDDPIGGNLLVNGNLELWFPTPFFGDPETMRMAAFFDIGNVFDTHSVDYDFDAGDLRYSTGVAMTWMSPLGVLSMSLGYPINAEQDDEEENFQFTFGTTF